MPEPTLLATHMMLVLDKLTDGNAIEAAMIRAKIPHPLRSPLKTHIEMCVLDLFQSATAHLNAQIKHYPGSLRVSRDN